MQIIESDDANKSELLAIFLPKDKEKNSRLKAFCT